MMKNHVVTWGVSLRILIAISLAVLLISAAFPTDAQALKRRWFRKADATGVADYGWGVAAGPGGVFVAGSINVPPDNSNIWLRKYSSRGAKIWTKKFDGADEGGDYGYGVAAGPDGSAYVAGAVTVKDHWSDIWVRKYSSAGKKEWTKKVQGDPVQPDIGSDVAMAPDGNVYVAGKLSVTGQGTDVWLRKYSPSGQTIWTRKYDGHRALSVSAAPDGNVYVCGSSNDMFWLGKYSPAGKKKWVASYSEIDECQGVAAAPNGAAFVVGTTEDLLLQGRNGWIRKYSRKGKERWTRTYNGNYSRDDYFWDVAATPGGGAYVTGFTTTDDEDRNILLQKYTAKGDVKLTRDYDHEFENDEGRGVAVAPDGSVYITGYVTDNMTYFDIFLLKYK